MASNSFKTRLRGCELLVGTFVKTASHQVVEILGGGDLDFLVIDAEHAPFDRASLDVMALAARATGKPALVRLPASMPSDILNALDLGFDGVLAPHALSQAGVEQIAGACRYMGGLRGFSNSPRAGRYGAVGMKQHLECSDDSAVVVCQIEDGVAVERLEDLVQVDAVDGFLIGRADLAVSLGVYDIQHPSVIKAVEHTIEVCVAARKAVGLFVAHPNEIAAYAKAGVSLFIAGSDQSMLRAQATALGQDIARLRTQARSDPLAA